MAETQHAMIGHAFTGKHRNGAESSGGRCLLTEKDPRCDHSVSHFKEIGILGIPANGVATPLTPCKPLNGLKPKKS